MKSAPVVMELIPQAASVGDWLLPSSSGGVCFLKSPENIPPLWKNCFTKRHLCG